mmetsp:Transcript_58383/g.156067  ORF Transcript_58383/g.156067 Transcript_58383/m.156067 type:complete len:470 (-) Transcript_58383:8-1417(-)
MNEILHRSGEGPGDDGQAGLPAHHVQGADEADDGVGAGEEPLRPLHLDHALHGPEDLLVPLPSLIRFVHPLHPQHQEDPGHRIHRRGPHHSPIHHGLQELRRARGGPHHDSFQGVGVLGGLRLVDLPLAAQGHRPPNHIQRKHQHHHRPDRLSDHQRPNDRPVTPRVRRRPLRPHHHPLPNPSSQVENEGHGNQRPQPRSPVQHHGGDLDLGGVLREPRLVVAGGAEAVSTVQVGDVASVLHVQEGVFQGLGALGKIQVLCPSNLAGLQRPGRKIRTEHLRSVRAMVAERRDLRPGFHQRAALTAGLGFLGHPHGGDQLVETHPFATLRGGLRVGAREVNLRRQVRDSRVHLAVSIVPGNHQRHVPKPHPGPEITETVDVLQALVAHGERGRKCEIGVFFDVEYEGLLHLVHCRVSLLQAQHLNERRNHHQGAHHPQAGPLLVDLFLDVRKQLPHRGRLIWVEVILRIS